VGYGLQATDYRHRAPQRGLRLLASLLGLGALLVATPAGAESPQRLTSIASKTWIWPRPAASGRFLGYMRIGQTVALRSSEPVPGRGCPRGFYRVEPRGYVCHDRTVALDGALSSAAGAFLRANEHTTPRAGAFSYEYALSNGAPMYKRVPTAREQRRHEWRYGKAGAWVPLPKFQRGHEQLVLDTPIQASDPLPSFLEAGGSARGRSFGLLRRSIPHGSMLSFTRAFDVGGRTFLLSTDLTVVPADRVRRFRHSQFHGVTLDDALAQPIAFFRKKPRPRYRLRGETLEPTGDTWAPRSHVRLSGKTREQGDALFHQLAGTPNLYAADDDVTLVRRRAKRPFGVTPGEKWMLISITRGTLVAYEDDKPVFATLISPGQGGLPRRGGDAVKDSTTPLGSYRITFKDRAATMSPEFGENRSFWIADVPFTQYFAPPFALHAAYWHESFGEYMSGGCINASPRDAKWLFDWSDPQVPRGWQGATGAGAKANGGATWIVVTR